MGAQIGSGDLCHRAPRSHRFNDLGANRSSNLIDRCERPDRWLQPLPLQGLAQGQQDAEAAALALRQISREFRIKHGLLFQLLQSNKLQSHHRAPALRQLILRLDWNGWNTALNQVRDEAAQG